MILTIGEPMGLLAAREIKPLEDVACFARHVCGAEVNFAVGMARLEHRIMYVSKIGRDPFGKHIYKFLLENNIDNRYVAFSDGYMTGFQLKAKVESGDPEVVNFRNNSAFAHLQVEDIQAIEWENIRHLHLTGIPPALSKSCREAIYQLIETAKSKKVQISFDPNLRLALWPDRQEMIRVINDVACRADIVLPGIGEGKLLTGFAELEFIADYYLSREVKTVIIKTGSAGAFVKTDAAKFTVPAFPVERIVDTVGAGDGFAVGVVSALLEGLPLGEAVRRGAAIGALAIMSPGDNEGLPTREKLADFMKKNRK